MASPTSSSADADAGAAAPRPSQPELPKAECDIVLQGGTASGVIYPRALARLAQRYRLRGVGGTSAGAIAAAVAAAAEHGRTTGRGGFDTISAVPGELGDGRLRQLFQPTRRTRPLLDLMLAVTGGDRPNGRSGSSRVTGAVAALVRGYPLAATLALLPGLVIGIHGVLVDDIWAIVLGIVLLVVVEAVVLAVAFAGGLTRDVPQNAFGICSGRTTGDGPPALTDWLSAKINVAAGLEPDGSPLTFGQLWTVQAPDIAEKLDQAAPSASAGDRRIDLRVITTCLSEGRPYELPFSSSQFFYDPQEWARLFPPEVMAALLNAPEPPPLGGTDPLLWQAERVQAGRHSPQLRRLPDAEHLPVIVAARMSLSLPLVISAVPLWMIARTRLDPDGGLDPTGPSEFVKVWFSDGGLATNFPVQLFDAALPSRPTYAINLQPFPPGVEPDPNDPTAGVEWARNNHDGLAPTIARWPERGFSAVGGFLAAMFHTARTWQDNTQLSFPGFRDRIVRVLQTPQEGGTNLSMDDATIERLAERGEYAMTALMDQFELPHYPPVVDGQPTSTGWDNHRWVRYRALLSVVPPWVSSYGRGRAGLDVDPVTGPPSYPFSSDDEHDLADQLDAEMTGLAAIITAAEPAALAALTARPRPVGVVRRIPQI